jgi:integrase
VLKTRSGLPKHCTYQPDRDGKRRVRFRRAGVSVYLTGIPWSEDFMRQYAAALEREQGQRAQIGAGLRTLPGSFSALCVSYYNSHGFQGLKASTQAVRRNILERFRAEHGHRPLKDLQRVHIATMMGAKAKTPEAANNLLKVLRVVLAHGVDVGMMANNPSLGVKRYRGRGEGHHSWTEIEIEQFQATHPIDTRAGLALALLVYTGQRRSDVVRMGWQHMKGDRILVRQQKTGRPLAIPIHPELAHALAVAPKGNLTFLMTEHGAAFSAAGFGNWFRRVCDAAGLSGCSAHGIRHAAGRRLADAGCSEHEIAATLGMSLRMVARYTQAASQERLADRALSRQLEAGNESRSDLPKTKTQVYPTAKKA